MFTGKPSARRRGLVIAAIAVGSVIATLLLGNLRFFQLIHLKAGDVLVQRGTNHAWVNRGGENCRIAFVLIDAEEPAEVRAKG